ncbi:hypothetical protein PR202_gb29870 [Eleusine coracana subsp. coracana]|uniref:Uncharacterized protein n=1 Tax=Eleusine coracana subsp. coracana TaxID=191504 RepID=A0AAV5G0H2_ELECO|nr:hypothetical protein PR202_gb29870 [Eleusine coracana subsp. coracana]
MSRNGGCLTDAWNVFDERPPREHDHLDDDNEVMSLFSQRLGVYMSGVVEWQLQQDLHEFMTPQSLCWFFSR